MGLGFEVFVGRREIVIVGKVGEEDGLVEVEGDGEEFESSSGELRSVGSSRSIVGWGGGSSLRR